jgi:hypothetical protein
VVAAIAEDTVLELTQKETLDGHPIDLLLGLF